MQFIADSLFDRLIVRLRRTRSLVPLSFLLILVPILLAVVDGHLHQFFSTNLWRALLVQPAIIIYVLLISPFMQRAGERVIDGLRPIVQLTNEEFNQLVSGKSRVDPRGELAAVLIGALVGSFLLTAQDIISGAPWLRVYQIISTVLMYAMIAWVIYCAVASTRLPRALLRQPLEVDIFDLGPFEPIGRESVLASVAFLIGATLGMVFSITREFVLEFESFLVYVFFAVVAVVVFFLNMRDTHRVLADTKERELTLAQRRISRAHRALKRTVQAGEDTQAIAAELSAWVACEERLNQTRTWPYNTTIIRSLLISTLMPLGVAALRRLGTALLSLIEWRF